jgi:hypothetical protein
MQSRLGLGAALVHASLEVVRLGRVGQHAATPAPRCSMSSRFAHCPTEGRAMLRPIQTHLRSQGRRLLSEFEALREEQGIPMSRVETMKRSLPSSSSVTIQPGSWYGILPLLIPMISSQMKWTLLSAMRTSRSSLPPLYPICS